MGPPRAATASSWPSSTVVRGRFARAVERTDELLERLLQVRAEDDDARSGWRSFDDARRRLRRAQSLSERRESGVLVVERGLDVFGSPVGVEAVALAGPVEVAPEDIQLVAFEALVAGPGAVPTPVVEKRRLFD